MLERIFALQERHTTVKTEILAGLTTFITMAYILFVAPNMLGLAGMSKNAVLIATALGGGVVSIVVGLVANYPICFAPGVGMLAFYSFGVVLGMGVPWQTALGAVFISGIVFFVLTVTRIRQLIIAGIPASLKVAITIGIGFFITIIGLKLSGLMTIRLSLLPDTVTAVAAHHGSALPSAVETILEMGSITNPEHLLSMFGLVFTAVLMARKIQGSLLIGIIVTSILGYMTNIVSLPPDFTLLALPNFSDNAIGQLDIAGALNMGLVTIIFTFTFAEFFDSMGTLIGTATKAGIADPQTGKFPGLGRALTADAVGVAFGAVLGTSTITAFVESAAGVGVGGKTGLTAVTCGVLFILSIAFSPLMGLIPNAATTPVLILVGVLMMEPVRNIDFSDLAEGFPAFMTIVLMPFTYSIANGIASGLVLYPFMKVLTGKAKEVHFIMYILAVLVIIKYAFF